MEVVIETEDGQCFDLEFWYFSTVLEIKEMIQKYHGFPVSNQTLVLNGRVLEDEWDTEHCEIFLGSRIFLRLKPGEINKETNQEIKRDIKPEPRTDSPPPPPPPAPPPAPPPQPLPPPAQVTVKIPACKTQLTLRIDPSSDSLNRLKKRIRDWLYEETGRLLPLSRLLLLRSGRELQENQQLGEYGVGSGSEIEMVIKPVMSNVGRRLKVAVLVPGPKMVQVEVNNADCVSELRKELLRMKEWHHLQLPPEGFFFIFNQNVMEEERSFQWHDVRSGDVIEIFNGIVTVEL